MDPLSFGKGVGYYAVMPNCIVGIIGSLYAMQNLIKHQRNKESNLIMILLFYYLILNIVTLLPGYKNDSLCKFQAINVSFFGLGGISWTGYIAFYTYYKSYLEHKDFYPSLKKSLVVNSILGIFGFIFPLCFQNLKLNTAWCWIDSDSTLETKLFTFFPYYLVVWAVMIWNFYAYRKVTKKFIGEFSEIKGVNFAQRLQYYPLITIVFYMPQALGRLISALYSPIKEYAEYKIFQLFAASWVRYLGVANAIAYGFSQ